MEQSAQPTTTAETQATPAPAHGPAATPSTPPNPRLVAIVVIVVVIALAVAIISGILGRATHEHTLKKTTDEAAIATVNTTYPMGGSTAQEIILPGNVQAYVDTPIYSRTNGYLRKWYFDIGAHVRKGQLLAEIETPEVDQQLFQSRSELERTQANADLAGVTSKRWETLLAKHAVSQQESDQNKSNYIAALAAVDASRANVRRLEQLQSYERILAPFDGIITARNTDIGDLIDAGSGSATPRELFHLAAVGKLRVFVSVPEVYADNIHDGDTATLSQDSNPNDLITGKIVRNSNAINTTTRTLNVEVDVDNTPGRLLPGAYVFVHFKVPAGNRVVTIPSNTLLFREEGLRVAVIHGNKVELRRVTIGHDFGNTVEITSGLDAHDQIILDPADSLVTGTEVHPNLLTQKGAH